MNITQVGTQTHANNTAFQGKIITKGKWPEELAKSFKENPEIKDLADIFQKDVIGSISSKKIRKADIYHDKNDLVYKISIKARNEKPTLLDKIKQFIGWEYEFVLSNKYHKEETTEKLLKERISTTELVQQLNLFL